MPGPTPGGTPQQGKPPDLASANMAQLEFELKTSHREVNGVTIRLEALGLTSIVIFNNITEYLLICSEQVLSVVQLGVAHPVLKGPSVVKELIIGAVLGLAAGGLWKMHHWNEQRKTRAFYDLLEKGEISVVVDDE
ncbi:hypothetical protein R6Q57_025294 [Mikania cordata]